MRIIDEKGRLFSKINIIDFLAIIFLLSLTPMFYFGYKFFNKKPPKSEAAKIEFIKITIKGRFIKLSPEITGSIFLGDKEFDKDGELIGEIVNLGQFSPYVREIEIGQEKKLINKNSNLRQIDVIFKINAEVRDKNIYYKDKQILEGGTLVFSTGKYSIEAEGITIVKDDYNVVIGKQERIIIEEDNSVVLKEGLNALGNKVDSSLLQITNRLNGLEKEINISQNLSPEEKGKKR